MDNDCFYQTFYIDEQNGGSVEWMYVYFGSVYSTEGAQKYLDVVHL